jgi:hypothetical protein
MTAAPARAITDLCSPTTFPGAVPFAPEPMAAANLTRLRAAKPPVDRGPPIPEPSVALPPPADASLQPSRAAPPSAKSP